MAKTTRKSRPRPAVRLPEPTPPPDYPEGEQGSWGQILNPGYTHSTLLIPRVTGEGDEPITISPAAQARRIALRSNLELVRPTKSTAMVLQKLGLDDARELRTVLSPVSKKGIFAPLDSLGVTIAFFNQEADQNDAEMELADQYEFVSDFPISIPCRVAMKEVPSNKSRSALDLPEWPKVSGVAAAHARGTQGAGALVGVLDTGVDADHEEFTGQRISFRYVSLHPNSPGWPPRDVRGFDTDGHGTHVCGILAGKNGGVAPEVSLYVASVIESETVSTSLTRVASGLNWIFRQFTRPDNEHCPGVLSMSVGFPEAIPGADAQQQAQLALQLKTMRTLLRTLIQANILPVVAIGNEGKGRYGFPARSTTCWGLGRSISLAGSLLSPGAAPQAPITRTPSPTSSATASVSIPAWSGITTASRCISGSTARAWRRLTWPASLPCTVRCNPR